MEVHKIKTMFSQNLLNLSAILVIILLIYVRPSLQERQQEIYEPVKYVCHEKCVCRNERDSLILDCTKMNMTHVLNKWPVHKSHLIASFSWNNISELQQIPMSEASTISLSFSHCGIETLQSALFIDAGGIEYLDLSWNFLTGLEIQADVFRGRFNKQEYEPISLQQLDLSHNRIESVSAKVFEHTPNLTRLNLNYNPLRIIDAQTAQAISSVLKLSALNLANTSIQTFPDSMVSRLKKLKELDVSNNLFKIVPEAVGFLSHSLEILKLGENPIEHFYDESFMGLLSLRELNVSSMPELKTIRHNTFVTLHNLQVLNCSNNPKLYHIHHEAFGINNTKCPLKELYLSNNNLKTLYHDQLNWSTLSVLELSGNRWRCDCELYHILLQLNTHNDIISPDATCSIPSKYAGVELGDIKETERACNESIQENSMLKKPGGPYIVLMKAILVIASLLLILMACYTFWNIMIKYRTLRGNTCTYPATVRYAIVPVQP